MDPYSTHAPLTALALHKTAELLPDAPLLECGCGDYSSPLFWALKGRREYVIASADPEWRERYRGICDQIIAVPLAAPKQWGELAIPGGWGMCLMDSEESVVNRAARIPELLEKCAVVVMHDAREGVVPEARYAIMLQAYRPWTWLGSNTVDVEAWIDGA